MTSTGSDGRMIAYPSNTGGTVALIFSGPAKAATFEELAESMSAKALVDYILYVFINDNGGD